MSTPTLEFWFEFASTYSYLAAMRIEQMCAQAGVMLVWRPFMLGPIFKLQGWDNSPFNLNPLRGAYMWRDMERLTQKFGLPWNKPSVFPRNTVLAARVAAAFNGASWVGDYIRAAFVANFAHDRDLNDEAVVRGIVHDAGQDADAILAHALRGEGREALRRNTERAIAIGICGAPNCVVNGELFWGEETLEDAIAWALEKARSADRISTSCPRAPE